MNLTKTVFQIIWDLETIAIKRRKTLLLPAWKQKYPPLDHTAAGWVEQDFQSCFVQVIRLRYLHCTLITSGLSTLHLVYLADKMMFLKAVGIASLSVATAWIFYTNCSCEHFWCGETVYIEVVLGSNSVGLLELCEFISPFILHELLGNKPQELLAITCTIRVCRQSCGQLFYLLSVP